jgi:hypothetical protein
VALIVQDAVLALWGPEERFAPGPGLKGAIGRRRAIPNTTCC